VQDLSFVINTADRKVCGVKFFPDPGNGRSSVAEDPPVRK
jgi:hypothetical protein